MITRDTKIFGKIEKSSSFNSGQKINNDDDYHEISK